MEKAMSFSGFMMNQVGPRNTAISSGFYSLIRAIKRSTSKAEEDRIVQKELELIRQNLAQPDVSPKKMKEFLVRLIYCEMLGKSASFAYIHALKMAQQGTLLSKRVGYLAVCLFLNPQHELILLLINTIQKDLQSTNVLDVCVGLTACSTLIGVEMIPAILPHVEEKLQHPQEDVRKKAVLVLHSFLLKSPQLISQMTERFQQALCDRAPGVMIAALHIYNSLIRDNPEQHKSLVRPLTSILKQVIVRKLSADFEFRGIPAPWLQIQILQMLAKLGTNNAKTSQIMYDILEEVLDSTGTVALISCGVQYECIMTITQIHPTATLLKKAADCITKFLKTRSNNLRYLGVKALAAIHRVYPECTVQHQMTVVDCLEDEDATIRKATLNLLYQMCSKENIAVISDKLLDCMHSGTEEEFSRKDHLHKIVQLAQKYYHSVRWYVDIILKILLKTQFELPSGAINSLIGAIQQGDAKDPGAHSYIVQRVLAAAGKLTISDQTKELVAWVLGEYGCSERSPVPASEILSIMCSLLTRPRAMSPLATQVHIGAPSPSTQGRLFAALTKAVGRSGLVTDDVRATTAVLLSSRDMDVRQSAWELHMLCSDMDLMSALHGNQCDSSTQTSQFDWTLSFLDEYVSDALEYGAAPYKPKQQRSAEKHNSPEIMRPFLTGLNFKPYASPSASLRTATESSPSNQDAPGVSHSPQASLSSGATGNSADLEDPSRPVGLKTEGVRKVWSQTGYSQPAGKRETPSPKRERMTPPHSGQAVKTSVPPSAKLTSLTSVSAVGLTSSHLASIPHPEESEEERKKQELARALFGNVRETKQQEEMTMESEVTLAESRLEDLGLGSLDAGPFADRCTEVGLIPRRDLPTDHGLLLDIESPRPDLLHQRQPLDRTVLTAPESTNHRLHSIQTEPDKQHLPGAISERTTHESSTRIDSPAVNVSKNAPSLLDVDDSGQHATSPGGGDLPSLPPDLEQCTCSPATEELTFDTNVRVLMRRVWHQQALVLVFYVTSLGTAEGTKIILDVPSNMKCLVDGSSTHEINMGDLTMKASSMNTARLTCDVPSAHMSLGGEVTYRDVAMTTKRLFFQTPIPLRDLMRPKELTTEEFGKLWLQLSLDERLVFEVKVQSMARVMNIVRSIHLFPVEIIGNEGIVAGSLLSSSTCLLHIKLEAGSLDLWVKSKSKLFSQIVAKNCSVILKGEEKR